MVTEVATKEPFEAEFDLELSVPVEVIVVGRVVIHRLEAVKGILVGRMSCSG